MVCLRSGVDPETLARLLRFIYRGSAEVPRGEDMDAFLALARDVGIAEFAQVRIIIRKY